MEATTLAEVWQDVFLTQSPPPQWVVIASAAVALAAVLVRGPWRIARNVVTIAHEGGHALVALLSGRQLTGIRLHSDTSGVTVSRGRPEGIGMVLTVAAGYVTPSLVGLGGLLLLLADRITALLWISILLLAAMLLLIRNVYGVISVVATGALVFLISWFTPEEVQGAFAYLFTWFLLFAGVRPVFELQAQRRRQPSPHSDADQLARLTGLPGTAWVMVFGLVNVAVLAFGGWLLLL
ncbi:M50 family metallopeptidase [Marinactinospora thermotolerans]|uniref:Peptidase M50B-like n=1 Tax=Marinactinospora thermotolerans DSM 45154 TaxID=1122192 RepID=A0A1T4TAD5_9ACTN|nr:M50 family metallopeptidase [Marinactinospora thermotolerans]SKA37363.1 Peptidase M50B-like [Marinactinospora thermotolerans DSM 45154]